MPWMYQVYAGVQPGRPRLATIAAAVLFLLALALAAFVTRTKHRAIYESLEPQARQMTEAGVRAQLPRGWERVKDDRNLIPGCVIAVKPPRVPGVMLVIFRDIPRPLGLPSIHCRTALAELATLFRAIPVSESQTNRLGRLTAITSSFKTLEDDDNEGHLLGRAGMAIDGQIIGAMLRVPREPTNRDRELFDDVCSQLSLLEYEAVSDPRELMEQAGISFAPPSDVRWLRVGGDDLNLLGRLRLEGGEGEDTWYLDAARTVLLGNRSVESLLSDYAASTLARIDHLPEPESSKVKDRTVWRVKLDLFEDEPVGVWAWAVAINDDTALLMEGRCERQGADRLREVADQIAGEARVASLTGRLDAAKAVLRGRQWLAELTQERLSKSWEGRAARPDVYAYGATAIELYQEELVYRYKEGDDGHRWWTIDDQCRSTHPFIKSSVLPTEQWTIRDDNAAHARRYVRRLTDDPRISYTELRPAGQQEVICEMTLGDQPTRQWRVAVDDNYACEPVLALAAGRVARDAGRQPAVFMTTGPFITHEFYWIVLPAGRVRMPEPGSQRTAWAACVLFDYDPSPLMLYYDDDGSLLGSSNDRLFYQQLQAPKKRDNRSREGFPPLSIDDTNEPAARVELCRKVAIP